MKPGMGKKNQTKSGLRHGALYHQNVSRKGSWRAVLLNGIVLEDAWCTADASDVSYLVDLSRRGQ
jgi:hypothetical protein